MSSGQRKRHGGPLNSSLLQKRVRLMASTSARASEAEPVELGESASEGVEDLAGPSSNLEVIDVTLDDSDETDAEAPRVVVDTSSEFSDTDIIDLTQDDSDDPDAAAPEEVEDLSRESSDAEVTDLSEDDSDGPDAADESSDGEQVVVIFYLSREPDAADESSCPRDMVVIFIVSIERPGEENQQEMGNPGPRGQQQAAIAIPPGDDPDEPEPQCNDMPPGTIRCPICMDFYSEIVRSGRHIVATICGHVFCNRCLFHSLMNTDSCPTCRADLGYEGYHRLYI